MKKNYKYLFGPVPSRRLGRSLGVSPIPPKTCNYSCVYCQIGRTTHFTNIRQDFFPKEEIFEEIRSFVESSVDFDYITLVGGANTANFVVGLFMFYLLSKTRNGILVGVKEIIGQITFSQMLIFLASALFTAGIAAYLTIFLGKFFSNYLAKLNYKVISIVVALVLILTVYLFSGYIGVAILIVSTAIGFLPHLTGVGKYNCMGVLIMPVLINFFA